MGSGGFDNSARANKPAVDNGKVRTFGSGATRDTAENKLDYEGFLSPLAIRRYAEYMHKNRVQSDGSLRDSDNWQKGIPVCVYMKSKWRHFMDTWTKHRSHGALLDDAKYGVSFSALDGLEEALCGELFNTLGYLHSILEYKASMCDKETMEHKTNDA